MTWEETVMPWKETCVMDEKTKFIAACLGEEESMAEICRRFDISRKTGYLWRTRYRENGAEALSERSRAPRHHPNAICDELAKVLLQARTAHPTWGPRKLLAWLHQRHPRPDWPAPSTVGDLLRRHGLVVPRRRVRRATPSAGPLLHADGPNSLWCADFKGWFRTGDGQRCTPLTISDAHSRFLLRCQGLGGATGHEHVRPLFEATFREYGLPQAIRTDNGPPFATLGLGGLSALSVWWIRLGIRPERIAPGHPEQNSRHERMHRTLKAETASPPAGSLRAQQRAFDGFRREFNEERPHEALDQRPPSSCYEPSPRELPTRLPEVEYPDEWVTRAVRGAGQMKWGGRDVRVTAALVGERVGLERVADGLWRVHFSHLLLGVFDERALRVRPLKRVETTT
jgi:putative transposase